MVKKKNLLILGAGQYGQVVSEVAKSSEVYENIAFLDDVNSLAIGRISDYSAYASSHDMFVAIGDSEVRLDYLRKLSEAQCTVATIISPKAYVADSARLMRGVMVEPMAVVQSNSAVGEGTLVCAGAIVSHNARVGDCCILDCGSVVGANAELPDCTRLKCNEVCDAGRNPISKKRPPSGYNFEDGM